MKVAIYCRLSEEDRNKQIETDDSESIQNQKSMLIQYSMDHSWDIFNIYSDDDYTGSDRNRPEWNKMLQDAEKHKFDIILCKTQSRFTRELEMVEKYLHGLFPLWGIRFISIVDNADTENKGNKKSRQINGLVNEWYLEDMSDSIKSVLTDHRKKGMHIGAFALYGYKKDPEIKGHLIVDEEAAQVVRRVFNLFAQGYGKTAIARMLNEEGIPNPTEYKRLKGLRFRNCSGKRNSTLWKYFSISDMLQNEIYRGNMIQGKYGSISYKSKINKPRAKDKWFRVENTHEPIIEEELWNQVQNMLGQRARPFINGQIGLFARKAVCASCGYTMKSCKSHGYQYLKCSSHEVAKDSCIGSFLSVLKLEEVVISQLSQLSEEYLDKENLEKSIQMNDMSDKKENCLISIRSLERKMSEYSLGLQNLYLDKVKQVILEKDYVEFSKSFTAQKKECRELIEKRQEELKVIQEQIESGISRKKIIQKYTNLEHLDRQTVEILIDYISIGKKNPVTKQIPVEIHWNF